MHARKVGTEEPSLQDTESGDDTEDAESGDATTDEEQVRSGDDAEDAESGDATTDEEQVRSGDDAEDAESGDAITDEEQVTERELGPGLFPPTGVDDEADDDDDGDDDEVDDDDDEENTENVLARPPAVVNAETHVAEVSAGVASAVCCGQGFTPQETLFVFDWDDTIIPSSWIQQHGLRLEPGSPLQARHKETLAQVASAATALLSAAKRRGTVVLLTNAERGWVELSCQKFLPTLLPTIENVKIVSARTSYESETCVTPLDWKVRAFEVEIARACGTEALVDQHVRKNIHSLGDSIYEREALLRATSSLPSCLAKSVKFVERPDICQLLKQLHLVTDSIDRIVQHDANLDMCIRC